MGIAVARPKDRADGRGASPSRRGVRLCRRGRRLHLVGCTLAAVVLLCPTPASGAGPAVIDTLHTEGAAQAIAAGSASPLDSLRALYYAAVQEERAIPRGLQAVDSLRQSGTVAPGGPLEGILLAYEGGLITLRAKHGFWPPDRLRHLRDGLALLDQAVELHPEVAEVRYLRLMSCYYLPGIIGRRRSVLDDFAALARLLPAARSDHPPELYRAIVTFVLEHGEPTEQERAALQGALEGSRGER